MKHRPICTLLCRRLHYGYCRDPRQPIRLSRRKRPGAHPWRIAHPIARNAENRRVLCTSHGAGMPWEHTLWISILSPRKPRFRTLESP